MALSPPGGGQAGAGLDRVWAPGGLKGRLSGMPGGVGRPKENARKARRRPRVCGQAYSSHPKLEIRSASRTVAVLLPGLAVESCAIASDLGCLLWLLPGIEPGPWA